MERGDSGFAGSRRWRRTHGVDMGAWCFCKNVVIPDLQLLVGGGARFGVNMRAWSFCRKLVTQY